MYFSLKKKLRQCQYSKGKFTGVAWSLTLGGVFFSYSGVLVKQIIVPGFLWTFVIGLAKIYVIVHVHKSRLIALDEFRIHFIIAVQ